MELISTLEKGIWKLADITQEELDSANKWLSDYPSVNIHDSIIYYLGRLDNASNLRKPPPKDETDAIRRLKEYGIVIFLIKSKFTKAKHIFKRI